LRKKLSDTSKDTFNLAQKKIKILGKEILPGSSEQLSLDIARLHTRTKVEIPIIVERAKEDGPILLLTAGVHGDEVNGIEIIRRIIKKGLNKPDKGTIICIPVFNVFGFLNMSREFPDGRDLNRVFPGAKKGSLASQLAYQFMTEIANYVDIAIDFHTGAADRTNFPQIRCVTSDSKLLELAHVFNPPFIIHSPYRAKSFRETMHLLGKTSLLYEAGKARVFDMEAIEMGIIGATNVMYHLGLKNRRYKAFQPQSIILQKTHWVRAPFSGMFQSLIKNGEKVMKGQTIALITDPYGDFERKVKSPFEAFVIGENTSAIVNKGDAIFHLGME
jgi:uncharacterized protein